MRTIVLWDIDNTLLYTGGAGSLGMARAFLELYGIPDAFSRVEFSGRSDRAILADAMRVHRIATDARGADIGRFCGSYLPHLDAALREVRGGRLMPGVAAALTALGRRSDVIQGLGTGNFRRAGELKLRHFGIADHFPGMVGGFGEDSHDRHEVIRTGISRLAAGRKTRVVIVGDTPHDVSAARANGAVAIGVATGRDSAADLRACGADHALDDLSDVERVVSLICG